MQQRSRFRCQHICHELQYGHLAHGISELAPTMQLGAGYHRGCQSLRQGRWDQTKSGTRNMLRRVPHCDSRGAWDFARSQFARVVKGVDLRSTAGNRAWARTPQLTCNKRSKFRCQHTCHELRYDNLAHGNAELAPTFQLWAGYHSSCQIRRKG